MQTNLQLNDPLVITRIQRIVVNRTIVQRQTIVQQVPPRIIRVPVVRTVWRWCTRRRDPLAQTFSFTQNRVISAFDGRTLGNLAKIIYKQEPLILIGRSSG